MLDQRERVGARVDRKHGDAVVAAIRGIKKPAVGMNFQFSRIVRPTKVLWQRRDGLQVFQGPTVAVISEHRHEGSHFTYSVGKSPVRVKYKVARARALSNLGEGRVVRRERALGRVQAIGKNLIQSE